MNLTSPHRAARLVAGLVVVVLATGLQTGHALDPCPTPVAFPSGDVVSPDGVNLFSGADEAVIGWDAEDNGGFRLEWSTSPALDSEGRFATILGETTTTSSKREKTVSGLEELTYYYHVRARAKSGVCAASHWSNTLKITQDATAPTVTITTAPTPVGPATPPLPIYVMPASVRITGTATDAPGAAVTESSGALLVVAVAQNTTPVLGASSEPVLVTGFVDTDGSWIADFPGLGLGTWTISAIGFDLVGNEMAEPVTLGILVVAAP